MPKATDKQILNLLPDRRRNGRKPRQARLDGRHRGTVIAELNVGRIVHRHVRPQEHFHRLQQPSSRDEMDTLALECVSVLHNIDHPLGFHRVQMGDEALEKRNQVLRTKYELFTVVHFLQGRLLCPYPVQHSRDAAVRAG